MRAPATFPDEPEPDPVGQIISDDINLTAAVISGLQASTPPVATGEEILANIHKVMDEVNRRTLLVNPEDEARIRAAALEGWLGPGRVQASGYVPAGTAYIVTRPEFPTLTFRWDDR